MKPKFLVWAIAGLMLTATSLNAAMLELTPATGVADTIPTNFDPVGFPSGLVTPGATAVTDYSSGATGGLELTGGNGILKVEYYGSEAIYANTFDFNFGTASFSNTTSSVFDSALVAASAGLLPFSFTAQGSATAVNGGPIDVGLSIAFAALSDGSFLALFNDGGANVDDFDYDDMAVRISVSQVPLPAAGWLLLSALLGLFSLSRVHRKEPQST